MNKNYKQAPSRKVTFNNFFIRMQDFLTWVQPSKLTHAKIKYWFFSFLLIVPFSLLFVYNHLYFGTFFLIQYIHRGVKQKKYIKKLPFCMCCIKKVYQNIISLFYFAENILAIACLCFFIFIFLSFWMHVFQIISHELFKIQISGHMSIYLFLSFCIIVGQVFFLLSNLVTKILLLMWVNRSCFVQTLIFTYYNVFTG
jgi:hypothetical protein